MQIDVDKDMELNSDDADDLTEEVDEYQHGMRRFIRTRGITIENLGSDVADPKNTFDVPTGRPVPQGPERLSKAEAFRYFPKAAGSARDIQGT